MGTGMMTIHQSLSVHILFQVILKTHQGVICISENNVQVCMKLSFDLCLLYTMLFFYELGGENGTYWERCLQKCMCHGNMFTSFYS